MRTLAWVMVVGACGAQPPPSTPSAVAPQRDAADVRFVSCGPNLPRQQPTREAPPVVGPTSGLPEVTGGDLSVGVVTRGVEAHADELRACFLHLAVDDACADHLRVELAFAIVADGSVANVDVAGGPTSLDACLCDRVTEMRFRAFGGVANVRYPLLFSRPAQLPAKNGACDERR